VVAKELLVEGWLFHVTLLSVQLLVTWYARSVRPLADEEA
jgi:hypothetical protein